MTILRACMSGLARVFVVVAALALLFVGLGWAMALMMPVSETQARAEGGDRASTAADWTRAAGPQAANGHTNKTREWSSDWDVSFKQAPELEAQVESGDLPPVGKRLPDEPLVVVPYQQQGPYGGVWRRYGTNLGGARVGVQTLMRETLVRFSPDLKGGVQPELAKDWRIEDDGRLVTFHLRKGVRWSDGEPFTADDMVFWYEHVLKNKQLTPAVPKRWLRGGEMVGFKKIDDYTVQFRFAEPDGLFLQRLATDSSPFLYPKHYYKQFHPAFTSNRQIQQQLHASGFDAWYQLFQHQQGANPQRPTLTAWHMVQGPPAQPLVYGRNPYYWKVDPSGRQLPYINRITIGLYDEEVIIYRILSGRVGFQARNLSLDRYPLLKRNEERGNYQVKRWMTASGGGVLLPNLNHRDPMVRRILQDRRVRVALSLAIDRKKISELAFFGVGEPSQVAPQKSSPLYDRTLAKADTDYDPARARELLDEAGLSHKDSAGYRLGPDGNRLTLIIEMPEFLMRAEVAQMVAEDWRDVGIGTQVKQLSRSLFYARMPARLHDVAVGGAAHRVNPVLNGQYLVPLNLGSRHALDYRKWFLSDGEEGAKPPAPMRETVRLYHQAVRTIDPQKRRALTHRILQINADQRWTIGLLGGLFQPVVVSDRFRNVPDHSIASSAVPVVGADAFAIDPSASGSRSGGGQSP